MKTELKEVSPTQKEIKIEIDAETVKQAYGKVSQKYARGAVVPGFRKGNAPLDVIRTRYREEISSEVLQEIVPTAVSAAIEEHDLQPLTEPQLHLDDQANTKLNGSQAVNLHVHVEVMPEIPTPDYKNLELIRRIRPVEDQQVEDLIGKRLDEGSALIPVEDRKSQEGDTVIVDLEGSFPDEPNAEPIKADDLEIPIGDDQIEKSFTENLVGLEPDDEKEFTVSYAEDFTSPALAGKTVNYRAKVKSVGTTETPELNDEWAQSLDEGYESLADLRTKFKEDITKHHESDADARLRNEAIAAFIEKHDFEIPLVLIENQARNLLNNFAQDLQQRGVDLNKVEKEFVQMAYTQMQSQAERDVRGAMLLEKVAELEKVEISDDDLSEELKKMAEYYRSTEDEIRESLEKQQGSVENIRNNLRTRQAIEALIAHAKITDGEWVDEQAEHFVQPPENDAENVENAENVETDESAETEGTPEVAAKKPAKKKEKSADAAVEPEVAAEKKETKKKSAKTKE